VDNPNPERHPLSPLLLGGVIVLIVGLVLVGLVVIASAGDNARPERDREDEIAFEPTAYIPPAATATTQQIIIVITATPLPPTWTPLPSPTQAEVVIMLPTATATTEPTEAALIAPTADTRSASGGCPMHTVQAGETLATIAEIYGVTVVDLWNSNDLAGKNVLEVGQVLMIPCAEAASSIEIVQVFTPGITTSEFVEIRNNGDTVDLAGWRLTDADGNTFIFPSLRLFAGASIGVFSRSGNNTPVSLYWGQNAAVWSAGEVVTLMNAEGQVNAVYRIP